MQIVYDRGAVVQLMEDMGAVGEEFRRGADEASGDVSSCKQSYSRIHGEMEQRLRKAQNDYYEAESELRTAQAELREAERAQQEEQAQQQNGGGGGGGAGARVAAAQRKVAAAEAALEKAQASLQVIQTKMNELTSLWQEQGVPLESALGQIEDGMETYSQLVSEGDSALGEYMDYMAQAQNDLTEAGGVGGASRGGASGGSTGGSASGNGAGRGGKSGGASGGTAGGASGGAGGASGSASGGGTSGTVSGGSSGGASGGGASGGTAGGASGGAGGTSGSASGGGTSGTVSGGSSGGASSGGARGGSSGASGAPSDGGRFTGWCPKNSMSAVHRGSNGDKQFTMSIGGQEKGYACSKAGAASAYRDAVRSGDQDAMARASALFEVETLREDLELGGGDSAFTQMGGYHGDVRTQDPSGYESHHIPSRSVQERNADRLPTIAITQDDHKLTSSYAGRQRHVYEPLFPGGPPSVSYKENVARKVDEGGTGYVEAIRDEIYDLRIATGDRYDGGISAFLDAVVDMIASWGIPGRS